MYWTIALRHLLVRPGRALVLLVGYALGVAVMIVLLSVGSAMLDQSRDASLVGGGELTALPEGIDIEAMRTGGLTGMFFGIDGARFVTRQLLGGRRQQGVVATVSPALEQKLVALRTRDSTWSVRAGGELPDEARDVGAGLKVLAGAWVDDHGDSSWVRPDPGTLYDEIDRFHRPPMHDSSWAEWHYFNVVVSRREWWYITLLIAGDGRGNAGGGEVLVTHRAPGGNYQRYVTPVPRQRVSLDTTDADVVVGPASVTQRRGQYHLIGSAGAARFDLRITPDPEHYFPAIELEPGHAGSGYVVPGLTARASGRLCVGQVCDSIHDAAAYHDHNWGSWSGVTWEWGAARGVNHALLYGGVVAAGSRSTVPFVLALEDSLGLEQVYRFDAVERIGERRVAAMPDVAVPAALRIAAARGADTLVVEIRITDATASPSKTAGGGRIFLQMRGDWHASGTAAGRAVADSGTGFFETWAATRVRGRK